MEKTEESKNQGKKKIKWKMTIGKEHVRQKEDEE